MTLVLDKPTEPRVKRWEKHEYNELVEMGAFRNQRVYLFRGELIEMPAMGAQHAQSIVKVTDCLNAAFKPQFVIRMQLPFEVPGNSMVEPDAAVVPTTVAGRLPHPNEAGLIIELSDSSIILDREKAFEYAAAGVPEYWIVDLKIRQVEVYRRAVQDSTKSLGMRYSNRETVGAGGYITPSAKSGITIAVADLLP